MMKRTYALLAIVLLLAGCASSADEDPNAPKVALHLEQVDTGVNTFTFNGPVTVQFVLTSSNTTSDPVMLNRIEIRTISTGAYSIAPVMTNLNLQIAPGQTQQSMISVWGYSRGGRLYSEEPVSVRGTAYLTGPKGAFVKLFTEYIAQR
jgi:hypothetical protein